MRTPALPIVLPLLLVAACAGGPQPRTEGASEAGAERADAPEDTRPETREGEAGVEGPSAGAEGGAPSMPSQRQVTDLRVALGRALAIEDPTERIAALERIRHALPPDTGARAFVANALVHAYGEVGDLDRMQEAAREVPIEDDLETAQMLNAMAYAYAEADTRLTEGWVRSQQALQILERLIEEVPPEQRNEAALRGLRAAFLDTLGWLQYRMGDHGEALDTLQTALDDSEDWEIRYHRGRVLQAMGRTDEAARDFAKAVAVGGAQAGPAREALEALPGVDAEALIEQARQELGGRAAEGPA